MYIRKKKKNIHKIYTWEISAYTYSSVAWYHIVFTILHCVKSVRHRSFSGSYFPAFGLNTERYEVFLRIQSECGKIRTRKKPVFRHFSRSASLKQHIYLIWWIHLKVLVFQFAIPIQYRLCLHVTAVFVHATFSVIIGVLLYRFNFPFTFTACFIIFHASSVQNF